VDLRYAAKGFAVILNETKKKRFFYIAFCCCLFFENIAFVFSQQTKERLELVRADNLHGAILNDKKVRILSGDVEFRQSEARLFCDRATEFILDRRVLMVGHVRMYNRGNFLRADTVNYLDTSEVVYARGHVILQDSSKSLYADSVSYFVEEEKAFARNNVVLADSAEGYRIYGQQADYDQKPGYAKVIGNPKFVEEDSIEAKVLTVTGDSMEMIDDGERLQVRDHVIITRGKIKAHCGRLEYLKKQNRIELTDSPYATHVNDYLTGNVIELILNNREVSTIKLDGNAIMSSKVDTVANEPLYNLMSGENIYISIREERIDTMVVTGRATSYYHIIEDGKEKGLNKVLSDEIKLFFDEDKLTKVTGRSNPGSIDGHFYPTHNKAIVQQELQDLLKKYHIVSDSSEQHTAY
jgi:lipopolysaccharide export system protein LptA